MVDQPNDNWNYAYVISRRARACVVASFHRHGRRGRRRKSAERCRGAAGEALTLDAVDAECVDAYEDATVEIFPEVIQTVSDALARYD